MDAGWIVALALTLAGLVTAGVLRQRQRRAAADLRQRALRGHSLEAAAADQLRARGYEILTRHPEARYPFTIDGEPCEARLTGDYLVRRGRRTLLVEVKTGAGVKPERRATRRQLLEYALHFPVDGVLLYDADADTLREVRFPPAAVTARRAPLALAFLAGALCGALAAVLCH